MPDTLESHHNLQEAIAASASALQNSSFGRLCDMEGGPGK